MNIFEEEESKTTKHNKLDRMAECLDDLCLICYTDLGNLDSVELSCCHVFHSDCLAQLLEHKWTTLRITFAFMACPKCKEPLKLKASKSLHALQAKLDSLAIF